MTESASLSLVEKRKLFLVIAMTLLSCRLFSTPTFINETYYHRILIHQAEPEQDYFKGDISEDYIKLPMTFWKLVAPIIPGDNLFIAMTLYLWLGSLALFFVIFRFLSTLLKNNFQLMTLALILWALSPDNNGNDPFYIILKVFSHSEFALIPLICVMHAAYKKQHLFSFLFCGLLFVINPLYGSYIAPFIILNLLMNAELNKKTYALLGSVVLVAGLFITQFFIKNRNEYSPDEFQSYLNHCSGFVFSLNNMSVSDLGIYLGSFFTMYLASFTLMNENTEESKPFFKALIYSTLIIFVVSALVNISPPNKFTYLFQGIRAPFLLAPLVIVFTARHLYKNIENKTPHLFLIESVTFVTMGSVLALLSFLSVNLCERKEKKSTPLKILWMLAGLIYYSVNQHTPWHWVYWIGAICIAITLIIAFTQQRSLESWNSTKIITLFAFLYVGCYATKTSSFFIGTLIHNKRVAITSSRNSDFVAAGRWAEANTPIQSLFMVFPHGINDFQSFSKRPVAFDQMSGGCAPLSIPLMNRWGERKEVYTKHFSNLEKIDYEKLILYAQKWKANYALFKGTPPNKCHVVWTQGNFHILKFND